MRLTLAQALCSVALLVAGSGCPAPEPEPPPQPTSNPAPPPPPKCNTLKDDCKAKDDTRVPVPQGANYGFQPPKGWLFAKLPDSSIAQVGDRGAVLIATSYKRPSPAKRYASRIEMVRSLAVVAGLDPGNIQIALLQPPIRNDMAGLKMSLWEVGASKRGADSGGLLIASAEVGDHELLIVGFAPKDDQAGTDAIMSALRTLAPMEPEAAEAPDGAEGDST